MNIGIVIPAYNVGDRLQDVLSKSLTYISKDRIYVVDDGSTDSTGDVATAMGVILFRHQKNRGKGEALKSGFRSAIKDGLDGIITLDGDGQHEPAYIPRFISLLETTDCDVVLGVRHFRIGDMPFDRICSNRISSLIVSVIAGKWIPDSQCGYRLIRTAVIENLHFASSHYELESELLIKAAKKGCTFSFCPIPVHYEGAGSHIHRFRDTQRFCRMVVRLLKDRTMHTKY